MYAAAPWIVASAIAAIRSTVPSKLKIHTSSRPPRKFLAHSRNRGHSQHSGKQVSECRRIGELRRDSSVGGSWRQEHQSEVPERMKYKNRQQNGLWSQLRESREDIDSGGNPEHEGTEQEIDSENIHRVTLTALLTLATAPNY